MFKNVIKPTLVLGIICVVVSALLSFTYHAAGIAELGTGLSEEQLTEAAAVALPGAVFKKTDAVSENPKFISAYSDSNGNGSAIFMTADGYHGSDSLRLVIGFNNEGAVSGCYVVEHGETPGLGSKALEQSYLENFIGITSPVVVDKTGQVDVDAIAGSTISSKAVGDAFNLALEIYNEIKGEL